MKHSTRIQRARRVVAVVTSVLFISSHAIAAQVQFIGPGSNWGVDANWSSNSLPGPNDDVLLGSFNTVLSFGGFAVRSFAGTGMFSMSGGSLDYSAPSSLGSISFARGTISGSATLTINTGVWGSSDQAIMTGGGTTIFQGNLDLVGNGRRTVSQQRTVRFEGLTTLTNQAGGPQGVIDLQSGGSITNTGTFQDQTAIAMVFNNNGGGGAFTNSGTYVKSGASTTDLSSIRYINQGTTIVNRGVIRLANNYVNQGTLAGTGAFATNILSNAGNITPGRSTGTLDITGSYTQLGAGRLSIEVENLSSFDLLRVSGSAIVDGTLNVICFATCSYEVGDTIKILDASANVNSLSGSFSAVVLTGFLTGRFDVVYDRTQGDVLLRVTEQVRAVPEVSSALMMIIGCLTLCWYWRRQRRASIDSR
jgi:hypothetical protein